MISKTSIIEYTNCIIHHYCHEMDEGFYSNNDSDSIFSKIYDVVSSCLVERRKEK